MLRTERLLKILVALWAEILWAGWKKLTFFDWFCTLLYVYDYFWEGIESRVKHVDVVFYLIKGSPHEHEVFTVPTGTKAALFSVCPHLLSGIHISEFKRKREREFLNTTKAATVTKVLELVKSLQFSGICTPFSWLVMEDAIVSSGFRMQNLRLQFLSSGSSRRWAWRKPTCRRRVDWTGAFNFNRNGSLSYHVCFCT